MLHDTLIEAGFTHIHRPEEYWDDGDGENGPHLTGHGAYDEYVDGEAYFILVDGAIVHIEMRDHKFEAYIDSMYEKGA